jgi:uncharacterized caspase-like protein
MLKSFGLEQSAVRVLRGLLVCLALWLAAGADALADKRVALVIGNSAYQNVSALANSVNDAAAIGQLLKISGFDVVVVRSDLGVNELRRVVRNFSEMVRGADVAVIFYAGHGIEVDGINYLIPVDARLDRDVDVDDETLSLDRLLKIVEPAKRLKLIILDACRDNPFARSMKRVTSDRAIGRGLARVEPETTDTLIAFAAKAGSTASDGGPGNSPFTAALLRHITQPGLDLRIAFGRIRDEVLTSTGYRQEPFVYGSLGGSVVSLVPEPKGTEAQSPPAAAANADVRADYEIAERVGTIEAWDYFLAVHGTGYYANQARAQRAKLARAVAQPSPAMEASPGTPPQRFPVNPLQSSPGTIVALPPEQQQPAPGLIRQEPLTVTPENVAGPLQFHLKRVGCNPGTTSGTWGAGSRRALENFNKYAGTNFKTLVATLDAYEAVRTKPSRVCPLACAHGSRPDGERCMPIKCENGLVLGADGACHQQRDRTKISARQTLGHLKGGNCVTFASRRICE